MIVQRILFLVLFVSLSGCAFTPQEVVLRPSVDIEPSSMGANKALILRVVDERSKTTLGVRGFRGLGEELTISGDLEAIVKEALTEGLSSKGFALPKGLPENGRELRVEIRGLEYRLLEGGWKGTLKTESSMKGVCKFGGSRLYEELYRGAYEERIHVVPEEEANNKYVNIALSASINQLLSDNDLLKCLSK